MHTLTYERRTMLSPTMTALGVVAYALSIIAVILVFTSDGKKGSKRMTWGLSLMLVALALGGIFGISAVTA